VYEKSKVLNRNNDFKLLYLGFILKKFATKEKIKGYFTSEIINSVNITLFNDMINKKQEFNGKTINQDDFNNIELC
jgi:hypothetical protein